MLLLSGVCLDGPYPGIDICGARVRLFDLNPAYRQVPAAHFNGAKESRPRPKEI
jgi:hypothetical protein